jgi:hypothetical protein
VAEVIPYLGDTVKMNEVVLTIPGYRHDFLSPYRRQATIALIDFHVFFQIRHHVVRLSQFPAFGRKEIFPAVTEISVDPKTGQRNYSQLMIQFCHISRASDKNNLPYPLTGMPVSHDNIAQQKTERYHQQRGAKQEEEVTIPAHDAEPSPPEKGCGDHDEQQHHFKYLYSFLKFVFPIIMHIFFLKLY